MKRSLIIIKLTGFKLTLDATEKRRQEIIKQVNEGVLYLKSWEDLEFCEIFDRDLVVKYVGGDENERT